MVRQIFSTIQSIPPVIIGFMRWGISFDELAAVLQIIRVNRDNFGIIIHIFYRKNIFCDP